MVSVLVVDDEKDIRETMAEMLAIEGYQTFGAGDGVEALSQARAHRPDLVLLDLTMPGMNGWEFRAAQRGDPELSAIPVIVISALTREPGLDVAAYLQKPFGMDTLLSAVRHHAGAA
jgi:CheY-like chemotaxis protein